MEKATACGTFSYPYRFCLRWANNNAAGFTSPPYIVAYTHRQ